MAIRINGQGVRLAEPYDHITVEVDNSENQNTEVELRLTNSGQTDPAGRFRLRVTGDTLLFERALTANWASAKLLLTLNSDGAVVEFTDASLVDLLEKLLLDVASGGPIGLRFQQLIQETIQAYGS